MSLNWRKTVIVVLDIALAAYLVLAITAFNEPDVKAKICTEVKIDVNDDVTRGFLEKNDVRAAAARSFSHTLTAKSRTPKK